MRFIDEPLFSFPDLHIAPNGEVIGSQFVLNFLKGTAEDTQKSGLFFKKAQKQKQNPNMIVCHSTKGGLKKKHVRPFFS